MASFEGPEPTEELRAAMEIGDLGEALADVTLATDLCDEPHDGQFIVPVVCPLHACSEDGSSRRMDVMVFELRNQASSAVGDNATGDAFTEHESLATVVWPSAVALAEELASRADGVRGLKVLELGAGAGLCSLAAQRLGATVLATDRSAVALRLVLDGAEIAQAQEGAGTCGLRFLDVFDLIEVQNTLTEFAPDLIIASDLLFDGKIARAVARVLLEACRGPNGAGAIVADPGREARAEFLAELAEDPAFRTAAFEPRLVNLGAVFDNRRGAPRHDRDEATQVDLLYLSLPR